MKKISILITLFLTSIISSAQNQNGGQFNQNNALHIQYISYSNGIHTFKVVNKQNCTAIVKTKVNQEQTIDHQIPKNDSIYIYVTLPNTNEIKFKAKPETACAQNTDMGWIEISSLGVTLNLYPNNIIRIIRGPNQFLLSINNGILNANFGTLSEYQSITIFNLLGMKSFEQKILVNKSLNINLNPYLKRGINLVRIIIHNKTQDTHIFQIIKN